MGAHSNVRAYSDVGTYSNKYTNYVLRLSVRGVKISSKIRKLGLMQNYKKTNKIDMV